MFSSRLIFAATAICSQISSVAALYDASSKANVALYWGQGANQQDLRNFCDESSVDIIPIAFINVFPDQGNGLIGENFGNKCYGDSYYQGPGNDPAENQLPTRCPTVQEDIPYCQSIGKKILLSLGGATNTYALTGTDEGIALADFLWGAYGPLTAEWTAAGGIRPLDRGSSNTDTSTEYQIDIDGFDFDIEYPSADAQAGYIALIDRLRENFQQNPSKQYIISGAPQCPLLAQNGFEDANMGNMILAAQFDIIWIQFYNNDAAGCTARDWANANPNYPASQSSVTTLNYQQWKNTINSGASNGAQIYLGLLAGPATSCSPGGYGDFLSATEANQLISAFQSDDQFGGIMLYEATSTLNECHCGIPYFDDIKDSLNGISPTTQCPTTTTTTTTTVKTTTSSSSGDSTITTITSATSSSLTQSTSSTSIASSVTTTLDSSTTFSASTSPTTSSFPMTTALSSCIVCRDDACLMAATSNPLSQSSANTFCATYTSGAPIAVPTFISDNCGTQEDLSSVCECLRKLETGTILSASFMEMGSMTNSPVVTATGVP